jgi:hypothetical protein
MPANEISVAKRIEYFKTKLITYMKDRGSGGGDPMSNPEQLEGTMDMMKKNMMMIVPQTLIMSWISFFFSGFVLSRLSHRINHH